jgi:hypothetical protein
LKRTFLWKTPATKKIAEIFCETFFIYKEKFVESHPGLISVLKNDSFWSTSRDD